MNVLSLFDGMSCGMVALERAGIKVDNYYASEIDKYAMTVSAKNYPNIIQLGDIIKWKRWNLPKIDLIIGGSPCQGFSFAGKQLNFDDPRSKLFFEYVKILKHLRKQNSNMFFLLEDVKMKVEYQNVISKYLGVQPVVINSNLVSAQNRKRLYWTNISDGIVQPDDKHIYLKDILEKFPPDDFSVGITEDDIIPGNTVGNMEFIGGIETVSHKRRLTDGKTLSRNFSQGYRVYGDNGKAQALVSTGVGGIGGFTGVYRISGAALRNQVTKNGIETQINIRPDEKSNAVVPSYSQKLNRVSFENENSISFKRRGHGYLPNTVYDATKTPALFCGASDYFVPSNYFSWRKLTPVECERLQTLPDNYTEGASNSQRYRMIGNGWTIDVIAHIMSYLSDDFKL